MRLLSLWLTALLITACSDDGGGATQSGAQSKGATSSTTPATSSRKAMPEDPELASLYTQSCFSCHGTGAAGAPRTGVKAEWEPRMAKGMDTLLDHTINGFKGMPPLGMCMDCGEEEFEALIRFMAGAE